MSGRICWTVSTYGRPHLLPRIIYSFEHQTYDNRCMMIFDDGWQLSPTAGPKWKLVSSNRRCASLGQKRNRCLAMALAEFGDFDAFAPVDDDDCPLPWHTEAAAAALKIADWSRPSVVLSPVVIGDRWIFRQNYTGHREDQRRERLYHPAWHMKTEMVQRLGGYPEDYSGPEDKMLMLKMEAAGVIHADPCELGFPPSYIYEWTPNQSISGFLTREDPKGEAAWARLEKKLEPAALKPWVPEFDLSALCVMPDISPRPF